MNQPIALFDPETGIYSCTVCGQPVDRLTMRQTDEPQLMALAQYATGNAYFTVWPCGHMQAEDSP